MIAGGRESREHWRAKGGKFMVKEGGGKGMEGREGKEREETEERIRSKAKTEWKGRA